MKILILGFAKLNYMKYLSLYLDGIDKVKNDIHVVYWDRDGAKDSQKEKGVTYHEYKKVLSDFASAPKKVLAFIGYRRFVKRIFKNESYDYVISLQSWPAVLFCKKICKDFDGRFIFDYRDYTLEGLGFFKKRIDKLIGAAKHIFISSENYKKVLPKTDKYTVSHNVSRDAFNNRKTHALKGKKPIRVRLWGLFKCETTEINLVKALGGDPRFELHFHGRGGEYIDEFLQENKYENIYKHGTYMPEELPLIARETELLVDAFVVDKNATMLNSNRLYDGAIYYVPQIVNEGTHVADVVNEYGLGVTASPEDDDFADKIFDYISSLDEKAFWQSCDLFAGKIYAEHLLNIQKINEIFNN